MDSMEARPQPLGLPADTHGLIRFESIRELGRQAELATALAAGTIIRVRRGVYRHAADPEARHGVAGNAAERARLAYLTLVRAAALTLGGAVFTSYSAAVLHGLPIIGEWPGEV